jgi:hypothetical protein
MKREMFAVFCALLTVAAMAGCSASGNLASLPTPRTAASPTRWVTVVSGHVSGKRPATVDLGVHRLGTDTRVSWRLSGPQYPAATLTLLAVFANGETSAMSVPPQKPPNTLEDGSDGLLGLMLKPGVYHLYFSQRFPRSKGPGFDVAFAILTTP